MKNLISDKKTAKFNEMIEKLIERISNEKINSNGKINIYTNIVKIRNDKFDKKGSENNFKSFIHDGSLILNDFNNINPQYSEEKFIKLKQKMIKVTHKILDINEDYIIVASTILKEDPTKDKSIPVGNLILNSTLVSTFFNIK